VIPNLEKQILDSWMDCIGKIIRPLQNLTDIATVQQNLWMIGPIVEKNGITKLFIRNK
jgi:hypothetical protein